MGMSAGACARACAWRKARARRTNNSENDTAEKCDNSQHQVPGKGQRGAVRRWTRCLRASPAMATLLSGVPQLTPVSARVRQRGWRWAAHGFGSVHCNASRSICVLRPTAARDAAERKARRRALL